MTAAQVLTAAAAAIGPVLILVLATQLQIVRRLGRVEGMLEVLVANGHAPSRESRAESS